MKKLSLLLGLFLCLPVMAVDLTNITEAELEDLLEDLNGNMVHSSARGASSSSVFGFQIGLTAGMIDAPGLKDATNGDTDKIGNAGLFGAVDLPLGFGVEAIIAPIEVDGFKYNYQSIAGHWATNLSILDLKLKGFVTKGELVFADPQDGDVTYEHTGYGANVSVGKTLLIVHPYAGIGFVSGKNSLDANVNIFDGAPTQQIGKDGVNASSTYFFAGAELNLLLLKLGLEFSNPYENNKFAARIAFGF